MDRDTANAGINMMLMKMLMLENHINAAVFSSEVKRRAIVL